MLDGHWAYMVEERPSQNLLHNVLENHVEYTIISTIHYFPYIFPKVWVSDMAKQIKQRMSRELRYRQRRTFSCFCSTLMFV